MSDDARELLAYARTLLGGAGTGAEGMWPRACALLTRQALEEALAFYWTRRGTADLSRATARSQLICLSLPADPDMAGSVVMAWIEFRNACHLHAYELAPTAGELLRWIEVAESFSSELAACEKRADSPS